MTNPRCDTYDIPDQNIPDEWWQNGVLKGDLMWPGDVVQYKDSDGPPISDKETIGILRDQIKRMTDGNMTTTKDFDSLIERSVAPEIEAR